MKNRKMIGIIAAIVGVVIAVGLITLNIIQNKQVTQIYMTKSNVSAGAYLNEDNVVKSTILTKDKQANYITDENDIIGKVATVDLVANDILSTDKVSGVAESTDNQFLSMESGKQAISFSISGGADSLSNKLKVGDIIRIYNYTNENGGTVNLYDNLQYVRIASITSSTYEDVTDNGNDGTKKTTSSSDDKSSSYATITVIVTTEQAKDIIKVENNGGAYVSLISRGNPDLAKQLLERQDSMIK